MIAPSGGAGFGDLRESEGPKYDVVRIRESPVFIAKLASQRPALFIRYVESTYLLQSFDLEMISTALNVRAVLETADTSVAGVFGLILCKSDDEESQRYFLELGNVLAQVLPALPSAEGVADSINHLIALFAVPRHLPIGHVTGLVGELLLLDCFESCDLALEGWRIKTQQTFDFFFEDIAVEVKSSSNSSKRHRFSFEQLQAPPGKQGFVASLCVRESPQGTSMVDLIERLVQKSSNQVAMLERLTAVVRGTLGSDLGKSFSYSFDLEFALESLALYPLAEVPGVRGNLEKGVSMVSFTTDLSFAKPLDSSQQAEVLAFRELCQL